ncbi:MAG TPA: tail fiber domain-containing protein [Parafilimonas sp.]|nr:tail fiber domain-containing protein [Parafilimonas sp.]
MKTKFIFIVSISCLLITLSTNAQNWLTTGNKGTNPDQNFLGTIDSKPLSFRTQNIERIRIKINGWVGIGTSNPQQQLDVHGSINLSNNSGLFVNNLRVFYTQNENTFAGQLAGGLNSSGNLNTAFGNHALFVNSSGSDNAAFGAYALYSNTGFFNSAFGGGGVMYNNTTGYSNAAFGDGALHLNGQGYENTGLGFDALYSNTNGNDNSAFGIRSLYNNLTGSSNVAIGNSSLFSSQSASNEVAIGDSALYSLTNGNNLVAIGSQALLNNTNGGANTAVGTQSLFSNTTGNFNTSIGAFSLYHNTTGGYNTVFGSNALSGNSSGTYNTVFGYGVDADFDNLDNSTGIGYDVLITASNQVRIGDGTVTSIGGYSNWTNISDIRVKKNIKENVPGLLFINKLKPITYNLNLDAADKILQRPAINTNDGKILQRTAEDVASRKAKEQIIYSGFSAQDVERAAKEIGYNFSGVDAAKNAKDLYGLRYAEFVVPLVKAVQELSRMNDEKDSAINNLQQQINELKIMIESSNQSNISKSQPVSVSSGSLAQNTPNPFSNSTTISYSLPQKYSSARIVVTDISGNKLKQINLEAKGKGSVQVDASTLASGAYQYSLYVNDKLIETKQMVLQK